MARRGKPSIAHVFDQNGACVFCGMYKGSVERMVHVCISSREMEIDQQEAEKAGLTVDEYRSGEKAKRTRKASEE
jgi:hypothetical protein